MYNNLIVLAAEMLFMLVLVAIVLSGCATVPAPKVPGGPVSVAYVQFIYVAGAK